MKFIPIAERFPDNLITIEESFGRISSGDHQISICRIHCGKFWSEPAQCPEFDEYTIVLSGTLFVRVEKGDTIEIQAGQAILTEAGERVQYSTGKEEADYIAVCLPAFSMELAHREQK